MTDILQRVRQLFISGKFLLFLLGGGVSYLLKALLSWLFSVQLGFPFTLAYGLTLSLVIIYNFLYNIKVTFKVRGGIAGRFIRYLLFVAVFNGFDYLLVNTLERIAPWSYQISIFLVTGLLMILKFAVFDRWVFHEKRMKKERL